MIQKKQISEAEALRKLGDLCARGEHCSGEMAEKLRKWGIAADAQERIIDKLIDYKYVDDERFTRSFVRDKIAFNKVGTPKNRAGIMAKAHSAKHFATHSRRN